MEKVIYRNVDASSTNHCPSGTVNGQLDSQASEAHELSPGVFYPSLSKEDMQVWKTWLPTAIILPRKPTTNPGGIVSALKKLDAPKEVIDEFLWSWKMELFDTYEVRTPERRDLRDPLLMGRCGHQRYRIALWGESLRPFAAIADLVQHSLVLRARAVKHRALMIMGGTLAGGVFGLWMTHQVPPGSDQISAAFSFTVLGFIFSSLLCWMYSPERRQQDFLDRYRC